MHTYTYTSIKALSNISAKFRLYKNKKAYENTRILKKMSEKKSKSTPKQRIEFNNKYLFEKNNELWCRACNVKLVHDKKSSVKQHLETFKLI
jgi:hypothetical protein